MRNRTDFNFHLPQNMEVAGENQAPIKSRVSRGGHKGLGSRKQNGGRRQGDNSSQKNGQHVADDDENVCIICAEKFQYLALLPCNHVVCHKCGFRQRALFEKKTCLVCRTECEDIVITEKLDKVYSDIATGDIESHNAKYGVDFTSSYAQIDTLLLLEMKCPICKNVFSSFSKLHEHVKEEHHKHYCLICESNKGSFVSELRLYSYKGLQKHQKEGDEVGFSGHPECKYCKGKRFYSEDELNIHVRDHHERCYICDQDSPKTADYYRNYDNLFKHFQKEHFVCTVASCLEKKFVVFREELDLTAHMLKEHGGIMSGNKFVIGATGRQFQSQLSTFSMGQSTSSISIGNGSNHRDFSSEVDAYEVKAKRLEERAKHYLNYNTANLKSFHRINANFRSKKISASELVTQYNEIFSNISKEDINLLIYDLSELFPQGAPERSQLGMVSANLDESDSRDRFPALHSGSSPAVSINSWGNANRVSSRNNPDLFPALAKPVKNKTHTVNVNQPIRYLTVLKKQEKSKPVVKVSSGKSAPVKLTYLAESLLAASSSKPSSSRSVTLSESKFPALEKKKKVEIPRVTPISQPVAGWSSIKEAPKTVDDPYGFGVPVIMKKSKKRN